MRYAFVNHRWNRPPRSQDHPITRAISRRRALGFRQYITVEFLARDNSARMIVLPFNARARARERAALGKGLNLLEP